MFFCDQAIWCFKIMFSIIYNWRGGGGVKGRRWI
jgi:hypothetical protein